MTVRADLRRLPGAAALRANAGPEQAAPAFDLAAAAAHGTRLSFAHRHRARAAAAPAGVRQADRDAAGRAFEGVFQPDFQRILHILLRLPVSRARR